MDELAELTKKFNELVKISEHHFHLIGAWNKKIDLNNIKDDTEHKRLISLPEYRARLYSDRAIEEIARLKNPNPKA